jgi:hypothetical protein
VKAALVISDRDNVATALQHLDTGQRLEINGVTVAVLQSIPSGHKIAIRPIAAG